MQAYAKRTDPGFGTRDPKRLRSLLLGGFVAPMASIAVLNRLCDAETQGGGRQLTALGGQVLPELYAIGMGRMLRLGSDPLCCVLYFFAICAALAVNAAAIAIFIRPLFKLMLRSTPSKRDGGPSRRISREQSFAADVCARNPTDIFLFSGQLQAQAFKSLSMAVCAQGAPTTAVPRATFARGRPACRRSFVCRRPSPMAQCPSLLPGPLRSQSA